MSLKMKIRKLSFSDLLFISFGGQAPFISLLTFGTIMIILVGTEGALAMIIATLIVLFNGLVIYFLSKRFKRGGGYYVYAFYSLTSRLGLNTGWNYILYSISYGGTLLAGGAYVLYLIFNSFFIAIFLRYFFNNGS
jgi:Amino acid permease.